MYGEHIPYKQDGETAFHRALCNRKFGSAKMLLETGRLNVSDVSDAEKKYTANLPVETLIHTTDATCVV